MREKLWQWTVDALCWLIAIVGIVAFEWLWLREYDRQAAEALLQRVERALP